MDVIVTKTNPKLFDKEVLKIQNALADAFPWLDHCFGICETLTDIKDGRKFTSANWYDGKGQYTQIMPCEELGNFSFFTLRDPQEMGRNNNLVKSPFSLIIWYDTRKVSLPSDERNTEEIKGQILGVLNQLRFPTLQINRIYEKPQNVFADFSYEHTNNQFLMSPFAGLRIDGTIEARIPCFVPEPLHPYDSLERLRHYLYRVVFSKLPEDNGSNYVPNGGCSAFVEDGKLYRNLDFHYNETATFIVKTRDFEGCSFITGLNAGDIKDSLVAQLPYRMVDGVNKHGIKVSTHVLFNDWGWTGAGRKDIHITRLPFLALMNVKSMATIEQDFGDILDNVHTSDDMGGYLLQILITDGTTSYALLPPTSEGESYVLQNITTVPKLTNFRWVESDSVERIDLQDRPTGVERFNAMPCPLEDLRFTKCYEQPTRLSEFIGIRETTKDSTDEKLTEIYNVARDLYLRRTRDGQTWQTVHSVIYGNKMEELYIQENWEDNCLE